MASGGCRLIVRAGVGVDNIDLEAATRSGVVVMNTPGRNTTSTAEHSIAMLMALTRNIASRRRQSSPRSVGNAGRFVGTQLAGKTLGVVGLGRVGLAVCQRARGLQMRVIGFDPFLSPERAAEYGIELHQDLDAMLPACDFVTVHTPLTEQTRGLINAARLAQMKPGVRIVNCGPRRHRRRNGPDPKLWPAATSAGAAIDVFENEPPGDHPLLADPRVLATPHLGASTEEAQESVAIEAAEILAGFLIDGEVRHAVNMAPISATEPGRHPGLPRPGPPPGHGAGPEEPVQWRSIVECRVPRGGDREKHATGHRQLRGRAAQRSSGRRGQPGQRRVAGRATRIELTESRTSESGNFTTLVRTSLTTDSGTHAASATVFGNRFLRLVQLDGFQLDAYLDGNLLIIRHQDVPGLIGYIGTVLGQHEVNIAHLSLGRERDEPGG
ncbi:MAG: D-3-phosphoglycerate dehydrogenase [Planctomycetaceae bacterium]|nr:MAG: D-3-phosphoglycerate dehydrogenase [Planctomycetaceae bacterium]